VDVLVGAEGMVSAVRRKLLLGADDKPLSRGYVVYRGVAEGKKKPAGPDFSFQVRNSARDAILRRC
jgi:hypothetical protein